MIDLDAIKARLAAATSAEQWRADVWTSYDDASHCAVGPEHESDDRDEDDPESAHAAAMRDADLIAHAPADLAALVAEVERLRDVEACARDALVLIDCGMSAEAGDHLRAAREGAER